jgi:hypothetical protein
MEPTIQILKSLLDQKVTLRFKDESVLDVTIMETMHLDEGDDFAVEVDCVRRGNPECPHWEQGALLNVHREDLTSVERT